MITVLVIVALYLLVGMGFYAGMRWQFGKYMAAPSMVVWWPFILLMLLAAYSEYLTFKKKD